MLSNSETARRVSELMLDTFRRVDESVAMVRESCGAEEAAAYSKAVGKVAGAVVIDVLESLYEKNPTLKPSNWELEPSGLIGETASSVMRIGDWPVWN
jgi:hypothetical protein